MITLESGLRNSLKVLEFLKKNPKLKDFNIAVGTFTNCRECGLTFKIMLRESFTWCIYEHRNSDEIIINGKEGYISMNGMLPYCGNSKWEYLASFSCNQYSKCANKLARMFIDFYTTPPPE